MAAKKVGTLIKEARTEAGLSQAQLADKLKNISASDIGRVERLEKDFTNEELKLVAKALGVTQKSLLEAPKNIKTAAKKTETTSSAKKTEKKADKKPASAKTDSASKTTGKKSMQVTATERKLVELYRAASAEDRRTAMAILKDEEIVPDSPDIIGVLNGLLSGLHH